MGRVSDGNSIDGDDCNGVISGVAHVGVGSACGSHVVSVVVYTRDGKGSDMSDPSTIERVFQMPSLRSQSRLEWQRLMLGADGYTVLGVMPHVQLWLQR